MCDIICNRCIISGEYMDRKYTVGIITISDKGSRGERMDESGPMIKEMVEATRYFDVVNTSIISDDKDGIEKELIKYTDEYKVNLILTTGGTGFSKRDNTPEATNAIIEKECPGFQEYMRMKSCEVTKKGMLSRGVSGIRKNTLIINLPGSKKAVSENLSFIIDVIPHGLDMMLGYDGECGSKAVL